MCSLMANAKLEPELVRMLEGLGPETLENFIVTVQPGRAARQLATNLEAGSWFRLISAFEAKIRVRDLPQLLAAREIVRIEFDHKLSLPPLIPIEQARLAMAPALIESTRIIGADIARQNGHTGAGVKVAIVDSGVWRDHPALKGRVIWERDFTYENSTRDGHGHGTHCAGIVAADGDGVSGVAPGAQILSAKVFDSYGSARESAVMTAIEAVIEAGARVVSFSGGNAGPTRGDDALCRLVNAAVTRANVVVVVANGNEGPGPGTVGSPAAAPHATAIGASDKQDRIARFSSRGPTADGRPKPELLAPGVEIVSCRAKGTSMGYPVNELWTIASGTSMACPHASGAAALFWECHPKASAIEIGQMLTQDACDLGLDRNAQGAGRLYVGAKLRKQETSASALPRVEQHASGTPKPYAVNLFRWILNVFWWMLRSLGRAVADLTIGTLAIAITAWIVGRWRR